MNTPWGKSDSVKKYKYGIKFLTTPSHGGFYVPDKVLDRIPLKLQEDAELWSGSKNFYEEDMCWAYVVVSFPKLFSDTEIDHAQKVVVDYFKENTKEG